MWQPSGLQKLPGEETGLGSPDLQGRGSPASLPRGVKQVRLPPAEARGLGTTFRADEGAFGDCMGAGAAGLAVGSPGRPGAADYPAHGKHGKGQSQQRQAGNEGERGRGGDNAPSPVGDGYIPRWRTRNRQERMSAPLYARMSATRNTGIHAPPGEGRLENLRQNKAKTPRKRGR